MNNNKKNVNALLGMAAAGLMLAAVPTHAAKKEAPKSAEKAHTHGHTSDDKCKEASSCKGKGDCHTAKNKCKGHNECKGQGWVHVKSPECATKKN